MLLTPDYRLWCPVHGTQPTSVAVIQSVNQKGQLCTPFYKIYCRCGQEGEFISVEHGNHCAVISGFCTYHGHAVYGHPFPLGVEETKRRANALGASHRAQERRKDVEMGLVSDPTFLCRENYYSKAVNDEVESIFDKQRSGPDCTVPMVFDDDDWREAD
jgi:hypothetical protein